MRFNEIYNKIAVFKGIETKDIEKNGAFTESHNRPTDKQKRSCMFCGKFYPEVQFSKIAHAVSESIGNKSLFNHFECDDCNGAFGRVLEDSFGKYIAPYKFISQIYGKKSTMTIKDVPKDEMLSYGTYRMETTKDRKAFNKDGILQNYIIEKKDTGILHETKDGFSLDIPRQKYNPLLVYASLLKMAYSIMPLSEIENSIIGMLTLGSYVAGREPFDNNEVAQKYISSLPSKGFLAFYPGINPLNGVSVYLFCKKNDITENHPTYIFQLDFHNYTIIVPISTDKESGNFKMVCPDFNNAQSVTVIDFTKEEKSFYCEFKADKLEIPTKELEEMLRKQKLLKELEE